MEYDRKNTFILSRNDRKTDDKHPDFTGSFTDENGRDFWMSAWIGEKNGRRFFRGNVKLKEPRQDASGSNANLREDLNDDVPF